MHAGMCKLMNGIHVQPVLYEYISHGNGFTWEKQTVGMEIHLAYRVQFT